METAVRETWQSGWFALCGFNIAKVAEKEHMFQIAGNPTMVYGYEESSDPVKTNFRYFNERLTFLTKKYHVRVTKKEQ